MRRAEASSDTELDSIARATQLLVASVRVLRDRERVLAAGGRPDDGAVELACELVDSAHGYLQTATAVDGDDRDPAGTLGWFG